jgi:hypothetical protein
MRPKHVQGSESRIRLHLGIGLLALAAYALVLAGVALNPYAGGIVALALAVAALLAGFHVERSSLDAAASLVGLIWTVSAAYLALAVIGFGGSSTDIAPGVILAAAVVSTIYTGALYLLSGTAWLECSLIAAVAGTFVAALAMRPAIPFSVTGYVLVLLAMYVAVAGVRGALIPAGGAYVAAIVVGAIGAVILIREDNALGFLAAVAVFVVVLRGSLDGNEWWRRRYGSATLEVTYPYANVFDAVTAGLMHRHVPITLSDPSTGRIVASTPSGGVVQLDLSPGGSDRTTIRASGDVDGVPELVSDVRAALDFVLA